ncbi:MAG: RecX family transcriptional regulator [Eubacteriales bacterium]|nr:RecX family transcriptional regulator [Eubacteriales bacterium]
MAIVTGIRRYRGVVFLSADGTDLAKIREADFARFPLEEGDAFDEEEYIDRIAAAQSKDAFNAALNLLEASEKTKAELARALQRKGFVEPAAQAAVQRAAEHRFVDDRRYAKRTAEISGRRDVGVYALKRKLMAKGVSEEDAQEALGALDDEQQKAACSRLFAKIAYKYEDLPAREARAKASQALARRGFSWDVISSVLGEAFDEW